MLPSDIQVGRNHKCDSKVRIILVHNIHITRPVLCRKLLGPWTAPQPQPGTTVPGPRSPELSVEVGRDQPKLTPTEDVCFHWVTVIDERPNVSFQYTRMWSLKIEV